MTDRIAQNTLYLTIAFIIQKALSFLYFAYVAGSIGSDGIGKYVWALSLTGIFALAIEFGLGPVLTREIARDRKHAQQYLANVIGIKVFFSIVVLVALAFTMQWLDRDPATTAMVVIAAVVIVLDTYTMTFYSIFRAFQQLKYEAIGITIYQAIIVSVGVTVVFLDLGLRALVLAILAGSTFHFFYSLTLVVRKAKLHIRGALNRPVLKKLLSVAIPFALAGIFFKVYTTIDAVLLGVFEGDTPVGWYSVASKVVLALTVLPGAFATSYFPAMSEFYAREREKLAPTFERAMVYMMVISLPIAGGVIVLAHDIVLQLYGEVFVPSALILQILMSTLVFVFLNYPVGNFLNACNRQKINTLNMGVATVINVVANVLLIPRFGYLGAAYSAVLTAIVLMSLGLPWVARVQQFRAGYLLQKFILILLASASMSLVVHVLRGSELPLIVLVGIGALAYVPFLLVFRALSRDELAHLWHSVRRRSAVQ